MPATRSGSRGSRRRATRARSRRPPAPCAGPDAVGDPVRLERDGALAIITLDKPPLNLFDRPLLDALRVAVDDVAADPPRGLLVRAEGRAVSGGVDVHLFDGLSVEEAAALWRELLDMIHT